MPENINLLTLSDSDIYEASLNLLDIADSDKAQTPTSFLVKLYSVPENAKILFNGQETSFKSPALFRITKDELIEEDLKISVELTNFTSPLQYEFVLYGDVNSNLIFDDNARSYIGMDSLKVRVTRYSNGELDRTFQKIVSGDIISLNFDLYSDTEPAPDTRYSVNFYVESEIFENSTVVITRDNDIREFLNRGETKLSLTYKSLCYISSADTSRFRIKGIRWMMDGGTPQIISSEDYESLNVEVLVDGDYDIYIEVEELNPPNEPLPKIELINSTANTYNLNGGTGLNLLIRKNELVTAISVLISDKIYEFDSLGDSPICGINVPHSAFGTIGKFNLKLFPYSMSQVESRLLEATSEKLFIDKPVNVIVESKPIPPETVTNPYTDSQSNVIPNTKTEIRSGSTPNTLKIE